MAALIVEQGEMIERMMARITELEALVGSMVSRTVRLASTGGAARSWSEIRSVTELYFRRPPEETMLADAPLATLECDIMITGTCHCGGAHWTIEGDPGPATACNCTLCRRYGVLWAYDYDGERIHVAGATASYTRQGKASPSLEIRFCPTCACVLCWRGLTLEADGRRRIAVNLRLAEPEAVANLPIDHFDGLDSFDDLPRDGRCVRDLWF